MIFLLKKGNLSFSIFFRRKNSLCVFVFFVTLWVKLFFFCFAKKSFFHTKPQRAQRSTKEKLHFLKYSRYLEVTGDILSTGLWSREG
jgi:hypothetical protein